MMLQKITGQGQLAVGDRIVITDKQGVQQRATVRMVLNKGCEYEEIVFNKRRNCYFIISMMLAGTSWVEECYKLLQREAAPSAAPPVDGVQDSAHLHALISGALYCFMGWLTTRDDVLTLSAVHDAIPAADAIQEFAAKHSLCLNHADVLSWSRALTASPQPKSAETWQSMVYAPLDGTEVELIIRHPNWRVAGKDRGQWEQIVRAKWIDFNGGGWTWSGMAGAPEGWRPINVGKEVANG